MVDFFNLSWYCINNDEDTTNKKHERMVKMRRFFVMLIGITLVLFGVVGCTNEEVNIENIDYFIEESMEYTLEFNDNPTDYIEFLKGFNSFLNNAPSDLQEYAELQKTANEIRITGLKENDMDLFSESSWKQAEAFQVLDNKR